MWRVLKVASGDSCGPSACFASTVRGRSAANPTSALLIHPKSSVTRATTGGGLGCRLLRAVTALDSNSERGPSIIQLSQRHV